MKFLQIWFAGLVIFSLLAGCSLPIGPQVIATPEVAATPIPPSATILPSITPIPLPTQRPTFTLFPTITRAASFTPFPSLTPLAPDKLATLQAIVTKNIAEGKPGGPPRPWRCHLDSQYPKLTPIEVMRPREEFTAIWRLVNTGKVQWGTRDVAFFHVKGTKLQFANYEPKFIPYVVNVDDQLNLHVPMKAPREEGVYSAVWGLRSRSTREFFCNVFIVIIVEEGEKK